MTLAREICRQQVYSRDSWDQVAASPETISACMEIRESLRLDAKKGGKGKKCPGGYWIPSSKRCATPGEGGEGGGRRKGSKRKAALAAGLIGGTALGVGAGALALSGSETPKALPAGPEYLPGTGDQKALKGRREKRLGERVREVTREMRTRKLPGGRD